VRLIADFRMRAWDYVAMTGFAAAVVAGVVAGR